MSDTLFARCGRVLVALAALALMAVGAQAGTISDSTETLEIGESIKLDLLTSGQVDGVLVGDKLFKEFVYSWTNNMPSPENVNVTAILTDDNYGIRFQGSFGDLPGDSVASDASIAFSVHVQDDRFLISDAHLASAIFLDESVSGSFGSIDESFLGNSPTTTETLAAFKSSFGQGGEQFEDEVVFDSTYTWLAVQKDIFALAAEDAIQPVRMTIIDQTFSQVEIPEPSAMTLALLMGCAVVTCTSRRSV